MKAGWKNKPLGEIADILDKLRKPITKRNRVAGPYPYYGATGVLDHVDGYIFDEQLVLIGEDGAKWGAGDASAFAVEGKCWVNNHAHVLRPNRDELIDAFLIYFLNFSDLSGFISGMTVPKLNQGRLREIPISLPPLEEQQRIVAILDEAFEGLDRAKANAEANLASAKELFEVSVGQLLTQPADGWATGAFRDLVGEVSTGPFGSLLHKADYVEGGNPIVNPANIVDGKIVGDPRKTVTEEAAIRLRPYRLRVGDIVIGRRGEMGRCAVVGEDEDGWLCGTGSFFVRPRANVDPHLVAATIRTPPFVKLLESIAGGATMLNLSNKALGKVQIALPPKHQHAQFRDKTAELRVRCASLAEEYVRSSASLDQLRQSLLAKAFAGELT